MSVFTVTETATIVPDRSIGAFKATITVEENALDELEITEHPIQQGASITDHAYSRPSLITISVLCNDDDAPLSETYAKILSIQSSRSLLKVITGKRIYRNMLVRSIEQKTDIENEKILNLSVQLQQVIIATLASASVPPRNRMGNAKKTGSTENAGQKRAEPAQSQNRSSFSALFGSR
jgi:hypothetical protein